MPKKRKTAEEKRQEQEAKEAAKFLEREKAEYARRMKLAAETDAGNTAQSETEADADADLDEEEETSEDDLEEISDDEETENET